MASCNGYEDLTLGGNFHSTDPEIFLITLDQKEWVDLQRDCDVFGSLTAALYGPDTRSSADGNFKWMPRSEYLGMRSTLNPPLMYVSMPMRPRVYVTQGMTAQQSQERIGQSAGHALSPRQRCEPAVGNRRGQVQLQRGSQTDAAPRASNITPQTPSLTRESSNESSQFDPLLGTPTPAPRANRGYTRSVASTHSVQANSDFAHSGGALIYVPTSSITSLDPYDADEPPFGILRPHDMNRDRYDWIAPQAREQIHAQINAVWLAAKHPHVTQDSKQRVVENLRTISNQVYVNERKHRIQFYWLPRIWEWLQARKTFPQGSMQHQQATSDLSAVRDLLYPQEAAYIQQTIQARRQAEAQSLNPT